MQSAVSGAINVLEEKQKDVEWLETSVLIKCDGEIRDARIYLSEHAKNCRIRKKYGASVSESSFTDLRAAFANVAEGCIGGEILIDTLTVLCQFPGTSFHYLPRSHVLFQSTRDAWSATLPSIECRPEVLTGVEDLAAKLTESMASRNKYQAGAWVQWAEGIQELELTSWLSSSVTTGNFINLFLRRGLHTSEGLEFRASDVICSIAVLSHILEGRKLLIDTLIVKADKDSNGTVPDAQSGTGNKPYDLMRQFLCRSAGTDSSPSAEIPDPVYVRHETLLELLSSYLLSGKGGVEKWNSADSVYKKGERFDGAKFEKLDLTGLQTNQLVRFHNCSFKGSCMKNLHADSTDFSGSDFSGADLSGCRFNSSTACDANFSGCNLKKAKFNKSNLRNAKFEDADVSGADFRSADLRGVDLTSCNAAQARSFAKAIYDEKTKLPDEFDLQELNWQGEEADPWLLIQINKQKAANPISLDLPTFLEAVIRFDKDKVKKSLSMLKKEKFELYSEQNSAGLLGIVKSQTDPDLAYACKLGVEGTFACCTQNLNPCGGLRGSPCKHIYVLAIGLAQAGKIEPGEVLQRLHASTALKPALNREVMTSAFLKYKGVEAGEVDWRPTETIPEDYFAY